MLNRRSFIGLTGAAAGLAVTKLSAQRARGGGAPAGPVPPSIAALSSMKDQATPITTEERRGRIARAQALMADRQDRRDHADGRHVAALFHRRPLGQQRAAVRRRHSREGRPVLRLPGIRRRPRARAARARTAGQGRRPLLEGRREPVRARGAGTEGSRHRLRAPRHRGDEQVRLRRQRRQRGAVAARDERDAGHGRLPHDQRQRTSSR